MEMQAWELLPDNVLLNIFIFLKGKDRVQAWRVCSTWRRMFYEPRFWRSVTFDLNCVSESSADLPKKFQHQLETIGAGIHNLTVICPENELLVKHYLTECLKAILDTLSEKNRNIRCFQMQNLKMAEYWKGFDVNKYELIASLCHFLESQTRLQTLVISEALLPTTFGHMVMSSLGRSPSVDTLQQLDIFNLYACYLKRNNRHGEWIRSNLGKCQQLRHVTLNCGLLRAIEVNKLSVAMKHCLSRLHLKHVKMRDMPEPQSGIASIEFDGDNYTSFENDDTESDLDDLSGRQVGIRKNILEEPDPEMEDDDYYEAISSRRWREAVRICPGLRVSVEIHDMNYWLKKYLVPDMPLSDITLTNLISWTDSYESINENLERLTECGYETLETVTCHGITSFNDYHYRRETHKDILVEFMAKYPHIRSVRLSEEMMSESLLRKVKSELWDSYGLDGGALSIL